MCRIQVTHFSLLENSFGNLHHLPAYPAGPWGWVYRKELSSFVFYTGTRSIRNDAQKIECRCCTTQLTAEQNFLDPWSGVQTAVCLTVGQAPQIVSFHENMVGECLCRLWKPAGTESNHGSCMFHEANGRFQAQCACKGPLSSIHQRWQTFIQMHPCLYTWNYMKFVGFVRQRT